MDPIKYIPAPAEDVLRFQVERVVKDLFKEFLCTLEEVGVEHDAALAKLEKALPPEYHHHLDLADSLPPEKGQRLRKRVLDRGNDTLRAIQDFFKFYTIQNK